MNDTIELMRKKGACLSAREWAAKQPDQNPLVLWNACENPRWMAWWLVMHRITEEQSFEVYRRSYERDLARMIAKMDAAGVPHNLREAQGKVTKLEHMVGARMPMQGYFRFRDEYQRNLTKEEAWEFNLKECAEELEEDLAMCADIRELLTDFFVRTL